MASEYIASIIGDGAEAEIKSAVAQLDILVKKIVEVQNSIKEISRSNFTGNSKPATETLQQLAQVQKMQEEMAQMGKKIVTLEEQIANARKKNTQALNDENKAIIEAQRNQDANIKTQMRLERSIEQLTKARQQEEAQIEKNNNAYEQLKAEYSEAANAAKKLGAEYFNMQRSGTATTEQLREMGQAVREASKNTLGLHKGLFDIEQATGQSQRNVGNYNALMFETNQLLREAPNFALSARTGFMALSNNLPMFADQFQRAANTIDDATGKAKGWKGALKDVGVSIFSWQTALIVGITLLLQYNEQIGNFISEMFGASKAAQQLKANEEELNKVRKESTETAKTNAAEMQTEAAVLYDAATNVTIATDKRREAAQKLIDLYPNIFKGLSTEAIMAGDAAAAYDKLTKSIAAKIAIDVHQDEAKTLYKQVEDAKGALDESAQNAKDWQQFQLGMQGKIKEAGFKSTEDFQQWADKNAAAINKGSTVARKEQNGLLDVYTDAYGKWLQMVNKIGQEQAKVGDLLTNDKTKKTKTPHVTDTTNAEIKAMDELAEARAAFNKQQITTDAATQKAIFDDEKQSMDLRLSAYGKYVQDKVALYELESGVELSQIEGKLAKIEQIEAKSVGERTKQEQRLLQQKEVLQLQEQTLIAAHDLKIREIREDATKMQLNIIKSSDQRIIKELGQSMDGINQYYQGIAETQIKSLNDALLKGEINVKEYNDKVKDIQRNAQKETLEAQINSIKNYLDSTQLDADTRAAIEKKLTDDKKKLYQTDVDNYKDSIAKKESLENAWRNTAFGIEQDLMNTVNTIANNNAQAQIDAIDAQKTALEDKNKTEIDGINSSMMSQDQKDAATEAANARLAAQEKALDNEKKARQRELAQAQKQQAIMNIILKTAEAVITAYIEGDPYTKIPRAVAAAAAGAAELAVAIAAPLPQYATGTENHPGGLAVVGEKGTELVNLPSGQSFITPSVATVMDLPKHTEVIPHQDLLNKAHYDALNKVNMLNHPISPNDYSQALIKSFEKGLNRLEHTIKNKQETHFFWKNGELRKSVNRGGNWTHYVGTN